MLCNAGIFQGLSNSETFTETLMTSDRAVVTGTSGEQGPSAILETDDQHSLREYGGKIN